VQEAISQVVNQPSATVQRILLAGLPMSNLDEHLDGKQDEDILQAFMDGKAPCERSLQEIHKRMDALLRTLAPRERNILRLRCVACLAPQPPHLDRACSAKLQSRTFHFLETSSDQRYIDLGCMHILHSVQAVHVLCCFRVICSGSVATLAVLAVHVEYTLQIWPKQRGSHSFTLRDLQSV
jgi:hypothetical protein